MMCLKLGEFQMRRDKCSAKQSGPAIMEGRQIAYDREICITICQRLIVGEDLRAICAKPPMPIAPIFRDWVQQHQEARAIYRSACNFQPDRKLAKEAGVIPGNVAEWAEQVRANCERGYRADWIDRKYSPPDWNKVYPVLGGP